MNEARKGTRWTCPNGCAIDYVLACGGADLSNPDPDAPNQYFRMELTGEYTDVFSNGEHGVPKTSHDHADGGCSDEPQCPKCKAYCVKDNPVLALSSRTFLLKTIWTDGQDLGCGLFLFGMSDSIPPGTELEALRIAASEFLSSDEGIRHNETSSHGRFGWSDVGDIPNTILAKHGIISLSFPAFDGEEAVNAGEIIVSDE